MHAPLLRIRIAAGLAGVALALPAFAQPHPDTLRLLDTWLAAQQRYQRLPALSVAVQQGDGALWSRGYGYIDRRQRVPARGDTLYGICSISKLFTALAVMQQVEQGRYRLDDDMARLLPEHGLPAATPQHGAVTVRALLTHSGGLSREAAIAYWEPPDYAFPTREQLRATPPQALHAPGEHLQYSNHGMALLGELVERQGGMPYADWMGQRVLGPLGLRDTRPFLPAELLGTRLAQGWSAPDRDGQRQPVPRYEARAMSPSAGFSSSAEDLVRFAQWQLRALRQAAVAAPPDAVLSPAGLREMQRVQYQDPQDRRLRGLAWRLTDEDGERLLMHDGLCPGQTSALMLLPARQLALALLHSSNETAWIDDNLGRHARGVLRQQPAQPSDAAALHDYTGRYDDQPFSSEVWLLPWGRELLLVPLPAGDPMAEATRYAPVGRDAFRALRGDGSLGEWLRFERDAAGRVQRAVVSSQGMRRVEALPP